MQFVVLDTVSDLAKNGAPHENIANSNEVEGRAAGTAIKEPSKNEENTE